jgi:hypothetical protein
MKGKEAGLMNGYTDEWIDSLDILIDSIGHKA